MTPAARLDVLATPVFFPSGAFKLDRAVALDRKALLAGWCAGKITLEVFALKKLATFPTPNDEFQFGREVVDFLAVVAIDDDTESLSITVADGDDRRGAVVRLARRPEEIEETLSERAAQLDPVLDALADSPGWAALLLAQAQRYPHAGGCKGYIEAAHAVPGIGGLTVGWALKASNAGLWLAPVDGAWRSLADAIRFNRPDIHEAFDSEYGNLADDAGFLCAVYGGCAQGTEVSLISAGESGLALIAQKAWAAASASPMHYAKWAFSLPTPPSRFCERLASHDGGLLERLIRQGAPSLDKRCEETLFGRPGTGPWASVIVPLFGRADFMEHQLLEFSADADFRTGAIDLIYVIDDPRLPNSVRERAYALYRLYRIPFRLLWGGRNRGFSGANNLGASRSNAEHLVFLNSDAFPLEPGWVRSMVEVLRSRRDVVAAGARLLYPDGSVQHLGIKIEYDDYYGIWLNKHPGQGLVQQGATPDLLEVHAATGACLAVRKQDFQAAEGFDENYLAGDFEDSDLCLKLRSRGGKVVVLANTRIVHLERQSFAPIGTDEIRGKVVLFNAWRHTKRWGNEIERLTRALP